MKNYKGRRTEEGAIVTVNGEELPLRLDVRSHSPDGFNWGYEGSGPAQLALALLLDCCKDRLFAESHYQDFKRTVLGRIEADVWELTDRDILFWCANNI